MPFEWTDDIKNADCVLFVDGRYYRKPCKAVRDDRLKTIKRLCDGKIYIFDDPFKIIESKGPSRLTDLLIKRYNRQKRKILTTVDKTVTPN